MEVNYDVWGAPETWLDSSDYPYADIKYPPSAKQTFKQNYENGGIEYNTIDLSLAFWGIGKNAFFAQPKYLAPYTDNGVTGVKVYPVHDPVDMPCMFGATRTDNAIQAYSQRYKPNVATISSNTGAYNTVMIPDFNYQKIMVVPYILYKKPNDDYIASWDLKSYIDEDMALGYTQIVNIGYKMWTGDGINNNRYNSYECGFAPVFTHNVDNYDVRYNNKIFYARGGYSQLTRGASRSNNKGTLLAPYYSAYDRITKNNTVDMTTALAYRYCVAEDANPNEIWYYFDDNPLWQVNGDSATDGYWCTFPYIHCDSDNVDEVKEYILQQLAFLGLPFCYDPALALRGQIGDTGIYLPKFDINGITTGEYEEGAAALALPNAEWIDGRTGSGYDPTRRPGNDDYGYLINPFNSNRFTTGLHVWCMYQQDILDVLSGINNLYLTDPDGNEKWQLDFKGSNPDDYIVSCKAMLLDVAHSNTTSAFKLGPVQFDGIACYKYNDTGSFSFGTIPLDGTGDYAPYGDFRDYQPYTTMELYIPLCGTVEIDPEFFVGHSIEIIMMYDIYTGACTAGIYRDNFTLWKAVNGQIGADIPVSALQMGTYQNAIHSLQAAQKQNEIRLASSAVTVAAGAAALIAAPATGGTSLIAGAGLISGAAGLLSGVMQEQNYDYQIDHTQPIPAQTTAAETQNNFCVGGLYPILYVKRAKMLQGYDAEIYSHTIGNACLINGLIGSQSGLVMCSSVDLSGVPATVEEINAIKQALGKGVYV